MSVSLGTSILSLFGNPSSGTGSGSISASILSTIYGNGASGGGGGIGGTDPVAALAIAEQTQTAGVANAAKQPRSAAPSPDSRARSHRPARWANCCRTRIS